MVPYLQQLCLFVWASFLTSDMIMSCVTPLAKVVLIPALPSFLTGHQVLSVMGFLSFCR